MNSCDKFLNFKIDSIAPSYKKDYKRMISIPRDYLKMTDVRDIRKSDIINPEEHLDKNYTLPELPVKPLNILYCKT